MFGAGQPEHVDHLTAFTAESFGGRIGSLANGLRFTTSPVHRGCRITEEQRQRFVELYMAALDATEMPSDPAFRGAVREHLEFGSKVAMQILHAETEDQLHPLREVPRWTWPGDDDGGDPPRPRPWSQPSACSPRTAAEACRARGD